MNEKKLLNTSSLAEEFIKQHNPTKSEDKLLDVKNHTAFRTLMTAYFGEIFASVDRDSDKISKIVINLLKTFDIDSSKIDLNQGYGYICDDVVKILRSRSFSINEALNKLDEWKSLGY